MCAGSGCPGRQYHRWSCCIHQKSSQPPKAARRRHAASCCAGRHAYGQLQPALVHMNLHLNGMRLSTPFVPAVSVTMVSMCSSCDAVPGLVALRESPQRLCEDHKNAKAFANGTSTHWRGLDSFTSKFRRGYSLSCKHVGLTALSVKALISTRFGSGQRTSPNS